MAKPHYGKNRRDKELARKARQEQKQQRRLARVNAATAARTEAAPDNAESAPSGETPK